MNLCEAGLLVLIHCRCFPHSQSRELHVGMFKLQDWRFLTNSCHINLDQNLVIVFITCTLLFFYQWNHKEWPCGAGGRSICQLRLNLSCKGMKLSSLCANICGWYICAIMIYTNLYTIWLEAFSQNCGSRNFCDCASRHHEVQFVLKITVLCTMNPSTNAYAFLRHTIWYWTTSLTNIAF